MNLPTGTVTFLFTDIEGSARLAQQYRDAWEALRKRHHAILREAIEAQNGYVFQIVGDAFCAAFSTAEEAVRAAAKAQIDLNAEKWMEGASIKVRMGIHTGKAKIQENGEYHGYLAMSRVQRLVSVAHGGQILVSLAAQNQIFDDLPEAIALRDMGEHRLKDIIQPEHIYQLIIPGLPADFPPLKTLVSIKQKPRMGLAVRLIGTFEIKFDNKPVNLSSRIAQSLFAYLILNAGKSHRREKLAGMLWPDETEEKARAYLRHELWRIRKALSAKSKVDYLIADDINITFDPSTDHWLDVAVLINVREVSYSEELIDALSLFVGELLPGFYEDWIITEREHLQAIYEQKMTRLLELLESEKHWTDILEWAEHWISLGQGPEAAYRYLMIAYDALGDRSKVNSTYQRCVQALRELELEPSEQTRAVAFKRTPNLNIPIPLTSFIGREKELKEVADLLSKSRLVTLTGSGGVGKTRLAIQVVADILDRFPDGVWFLDLAPLSDPALVPNTLANMLGLREAGDISLIDLLINYFRSRDALIISDNCEHLIESCAELVNLLLTSCEGLSVLATSREVLRVSGEIPYRVPSLELPVPDTKSTTDILKHVESIRLFGERARVVYPEFAIDSQNALVVAQICQRLDGIPLAIELAAARANMLTVEQISKRLDDRFSLLTGGLRSALPRHQTLRATIDWSYNLLSEEERLLFRRLAFFVGGWTLEAAEIVCGGNGIESNFVLDLLSQLVKKSLVVVKEVNGEARYRRLETIRQYAREKLLETDEAVPMRDKHLDYFIQLAEQGFEELQGANDLVWIENLEMEHDNLRAALSWSLESPDIDPQKALQLSGALQDFWDTCGYTNEGYQWTSKALKNAHDSPTSDHCRALVSAGLMCLRLSRIKETLLYLEDAITRARQLNNVHLLISSLLWSTYAIEDEAEYKRRIVECTALARATRNSWYLTELLTTSPLIYTIGFTGSIRSLEEARVLAEELGNARRRALVLRIYGAAETQRANYDSATPMLQEALRLNRIIKDRHSTAHSLLWLGKAATQKTHYDDAARYGEQALQILSELSDFYCWAWSLLCLGWNAYLAGNSDLAISHLEESLSFYREKVDIQSAPCWPMVLLGRIAISQLNVSRAKDLFREALHLLKLREINFWLAQCLEGMCALPQIQDEEAARFLGKAETIREQEGYVIPLSERPLIDTILERLQLQLGKDVFDSTRAAGASLTYQQAIDEAMKVLQSIG